MMFESSSKSQKSWDGGQMIWQCIQIFEATDENDLETAMAVLCGEHKLATMKTSGVLVLVHNVGREMQDRMAAEIVAP